MRSTQKSGVNGMGLATLGGMVVLLMISFSNMREMGRIRTSLDNRLDQINNQIDQVAGKVDGVAARPPRRGPDPNRVYRIKTAGAPVKGAARAPITIAEFSDFQ